MVRELTEIKRRARPSPEPVLERPLALLPPHAREAVILTLYFGFRAGEVFGLTVGRVDFVSRGKTARRPALSVMRGKKTP
jgi:DNA-directed RNA polymerase specialized sigma24 family protein